MSAIYALHPASVGCRASGFGLQSSAGPDARMSGGHREQDVSVQLAEQSHMGSGLEEEAHRCCPT